MHELILQAYNTPQLDERRGEAWVTMAGHHRSHRIQLDERCWDVTVLIYTVAGEATLRLGSTEYDIRAGDLFVAPPHVHHGYYSDPVTGWDTWWAVYGGAIAERLTAWAGLSLSHPVHHVGVHEEFTTQWQRVFRVMDEKPAQYGIAAAGELLNLLNLLKRLVVHRAGDNQDQLRSLCLEARGLDEIAEALGLSKSYFVRRFKRETGITPWAYALSVKMDRARELLLDPCQTVSAIAWSLGFADPGYFARVFRQMIGISPRQYREAAWREMGVREVKE